jgi:hypothetical protein
MAGNVDIQESRRDEWLRGISTLCGSVVRSRPAVVLAALLLGLAIIYVGGRSILQGTGNDASIFYYSARLLFQGENPYDPAQLRTMWENNRSATDNGVPPYPFVNPPSTALLVAPLVPFSIDTFRQLYALLNVACLLLSVFLLDCIFAARAPPAVRLLLATWAILMPPVMKALSYGQSPLLVCAASAAALFFLQRKRDVAAGVCLALAFAKFTLTLPLLGVLLVRGRWKPALVSLGVFGAVNLGFVLPLGLGTTLTTYRAAVASVDGVGGMNDIFSPLSLEPYHIVSLKQFFYLLIGPERGPAELAAMIAGALFVVGAAWLLYRHRPLRPALEDPLDVALAMMVAMATMYHRVYDLAALMFVIYPLVAYRLENPARRIMSWTFAMGTLFILSFFVVGTRWSLPFDYVLSWLHLPPSTRFGSVLVVVLLIVVGMMMALDGARPASARREMQRARG